MSYWILASIIFGVALWLFGCHLEPFAVESFSEHNGYKYSNYKWLWAEVIGLLIALGPICICLILGDKS